MDLNEFRINAAKEKDQLIALLNKLEEDPPENLPELIETADKEVWNEVDCLGCANCCKTMTPAFTREDIVRIATHLRMQPATFTKKWLKKDQKSGHWQNTTQPCQFLNMKDNKCSIYEVRPADCAEFPHHNKTPFNVYSETFKKNIVHCPATFALVKRMENGLIA